MNVSTLEQLVAEVNQATAGLVFDDARVARTLDARTVRYYTAQGLIPKPSRDGRRAVYGEVHRDRLVAVRRLLAAGMSLARIAVVLAGKTSAAELDQAVEAAQRDFAAGTPAPPPAADAVPFWERHPTLAGQPPAPLAIAPQTTGTYTYSPARAVAATAQSGASRLFAGQATPGPGAVLVISPTVRLISDTPLDPAVATYLRASIASALTTATPEENPS